MKKTVLTVLFLLYCGHTLAGDVRKQIESRNQAWAEAINRGDIEAVSAFYDEGFLAIPSGGEPITDRIQLEQLLAGFASVGKDLRFETLSVRVAGKYAYELGKTHYLLIGEDGSESPVSDEYLVIWKQGEDGVWYYHVDAWWPSG